MAGPGASPAHPPAPPLTVDSPHDAILDHFRTRIVPPLSGAGHKGSHGRLAVLGGSASYAGAPALAGLAAARFGADLVTVLTPASGGAAAAIQAFSPELMVTAVPTAAAVSEFLPRVHGLLVGPGLGRGEEALDLAAAVLTDVFHGGPAARGGHRGHIPVVLDADGLYLLASRPAVWEAARGYRGRLIATPNAAEATRLVAAAAKLGFPASSPGGGDGGSGGGGGARHVPDLAALLGHRGVLVAKGATDILSWRPSVGTDGVPVGGGGGDWKVDVGGCPRRAGGQGDVLAGCLATAAVWEGLASPPPSHSADGDGSAGGGAPVAQLSTPPAAAYASCVVARTAAAAAFAKHRRAMGATDVLAEVGGAFDKLFPC
ncbi:hypothetical protein MMPV_007582 [Pyropia vietnamensis]